MTHLDYWIECVECALDAADITATAEQIQQIAKDMQNGHENIGQAFYQPESPYPREIASLKAELERERAKITCRNCNGRGRIYTQGPHHGSDTQCWKCHGEGKV